MLELENSATTTGYDNLLKKYNFINLSNYIGVKL